MPCIVYLSAWKVRARQRTIHRSRTFIARRSVWEKRFNKCWLWRSKFQCASKHSHRSRVYIFHFSYSFGVCNGHLADIYRSRGPFHCITAALSHAQTTRSISVISHIHIRIAHTFSLPYSNWEFGCLYYLSHISKTLFITKCHFRALSCMTNESTIR